MIFLFSTPQLIQHLTDITNITLNTEIEVGKYGTDTLYMKAYKGTGTINNTGLNIDNTITTSNIIPIDIRGTILVSGKYHSINASGGGYYLLSCNIETSGVILYADGGWVGTEYAVIIYYIKKSNP